MDNIKKVINEDGTELTIDFIFGFDVPEYNKHYIAYTINDDGKSDIVNVILSEYGEDNTIRSIPFEEREEVYSAYEEAKKVALESEVQ